MEILIYRLAGLRRQLGRKARTGQSSMCTRKLSPVLSSSLSFRNQGRYQLTGQISDVSAVLKAQMCDNTWFFCRALMGASTQTVPAWAGWVTRTGGSEDEVPKLSRVDYLSPIINPITENISSTTVRHILKVSQQASIRGWPRIYIYSGHGTGTGLQSKQCVSAHPASQVQESP